MLKIKHLFVQPLDRINYLFLESWLEFHLPHPALITAREAWSRLKDPKKQRIRLQSEEIKKWMRNKIINFN